MCVQIWFTLLLSVSTLVECLLAASLSLWYRVSVFPSLRTCSPDLTSPLRPHHVTCECTGGFIDPPSLNVVAHSFAGASDCTSLADVLSVFHWVLLGLYAAGAILSVLAAFLAARRLHSLGVFGKSGVYAVTPKPTTPTPDNMTTQHLLIGSPSHSVPFSATLPASTMPGFILNQRQATIN